VFKAEILRPHLTLWTAHPTVENYVEAAQRLPLGRLFVNSTVMTVGVTVGVIVLSVFAAYGFARTRLPAGRRCSSCSSPRSCSRRL